MKGLILFLAILGLGLVGGVGCSRSNEQPGTEPSPSSTVIEAVLETSSATTTVNPLLSSPVSEWSRYEFKELGFSMQLPFATSVVEFGFEDCSVLEVPCQDSVYSYQGTLTNSNSPADRYVFIASYSEKFVAERSLQVTDITDFRLSPKPTIIPPSSDSTAFEYAINPVYSYTLKAGPVMIFDQDKDFYNRSAADFGVPEKQGEAWGVVFKLPSSKKFKAVVLRFYDNDFPLEKIKQSLPTIRFN